VWQKSHELALSIYRETKMFPKEETFGLTSQMRRAASSVSANIAEGCGRGSDADLSRFLQIAFGSISELDCQLILARDLNLLSVKTYEDIYSRVVEVRRMLASLIRKIKAGT
jgi:four helix bundle protein